ncbi:IS3 family transposase [Weissella muntiaci]|uniref:IS3 family transposase n=1 Tax=Weissella muntiaci TaxID=2508881 RepID=A0A6C2C477_9LACO|nr:IS3 family transposase [Weissella muntiaci]
MSSGRIYRLIKSVNLPRMSAVKPKFRYRKKFENQQLPNILDQQFFTEQPNRKWTSDMTFIRTITVNVYLDIIIDAFSRKIISWKISPRMTSQFIVELISNALRKRKTSSNLILHTDRGSQYTSHAVRQFLYPNQINHSFSKIGYPWDNAITESFFKYTKKEEYNRRKFHDISEVRKAAFNYIEGFYNTRRPHSANKFMSPNQKELEFYTQ